MFRPEIATIPHTRAEAARAQFDEYGHVSVSGLFAQRLLEPALEDSTRLVRHTHNEGQRENVKHLRTANPESNENLYAVLQGAQEGAAILGGALSLTHGCRLNLRQMDKRTTGEIKTNAGSLVGGVVATIALEGSYYYTLSEGPVREGVDYVMEPGNIVFEDLGRKLKHLSHTWDEDRTHLVVATDLRALTALEAAIDIPHEEAA